MLTKNLIEGEITLDKIFTFYEDLKRQNVIRLLLRCKKMYEARADVKKILELIIVQQDLFS